MHVHLCKVYLLGVSIITTLSQDFVILGQNKSTLLGNHSMDKVVKNKHIIYAINSKIKPTFNPKEVITALGKVISERSHFHHEKCFS